MISNLEFNVLYDNGNPLCFIGDSNGGKEMFEYFSQYRHCEKIRYEEVLTKDQEWVDSRQFIAITPSIKFKKTIIDGISHLNPNYFSIYSTQNHIGFNVAIGRGVLIYSFNSILDGVNIGDHVVITTHTNLSYMSTVKDFCHIGPYSQILISTIGKGCYMAARTSVVGTKEKPTLVTDYCNFIIGSAVTKDIECAGTYHGNRLLDKFTSLDRKID